MSKSVSSSIVNFSLTWIIVSTVVSGFLLLVWMLLFASLNTGVQQKIIRSYLYGLSLGAALLILAYLFGQLLPQDFASKNVRLALVTLGLLITLQLPLVIFAGALMLLKRWDVWLGWTCLIASTSFVILLSQVRLE